MRRLVLLFALALPGLSRAPTAAPPVPEARAACTVTVRASNGGPAPIEVDLAASRVRTKNGLWKRLAPRDGLCTRPTLHLGPGAQALGESCTLGLSCRRDRQYRFRVTLGERARWLDFPSAEGTTQAATLDLGDLARLF